MARPRSGAPRGSRPCGSRSPTRRSRPSGRCVAPMPTPPTSQLPSNMPAPGGPPPVPGRARRAGGVPGARPGRGARLCGRDPPVLTVTASGRRPCGPRVRCGSPGRRRTTRRRRRRRRTARRWTTSTPMARATPAPTAAACTGAAPRGRARSALSVGAPPPARAGRAGRLSPAGARRAQLTTLGAQNNLRLRRRARIRFGSAVPEARHAADGAAPRAQDGRVLDRVRLLRRVVRRQVCPGAPRQCYPRALLVCASAPLRVCLHLCAGARQRRPCLAARAGSLRGAVLLAKSTRPCAVGGVLDGACAARR